MMCQVGRGTWSRAEHIPKVPAADGEAYRDARMEQARRSGVADSVYFDKGYRNRSRDRAAW
jgi:hypothetical protein